MIELGLLGSLARVGAPVPKKSGLKPWRQECWCIPPEQDAAFVAAMEGIRDLYAMPPDLRNPWSASPSPASSCSPRCARRIQPHLTPKHGSWLNIAEIEISALSRRAAAGSARRNQSATPVKGQFTTADARQKRRRPSPSVSSGHKTRRGQSLCRR